MGTKGIEENYCVAIRINGMQDMECMQGRTLVHPLSLGMHGKARKFTCKACKLQLCKSKAEERGSGCERCEKKAWQCKSNRILVFNCNNGGLCVLHLFEGRVHSRSTTRCGGGEKWGGAPTAAQPKFALFRQKALTVL